MSVRHDIMLNMKRGWILHSTVMLSELVQAAMDNTGCVQFHRQCIVEADTEQYDGQNTQWDMVVPTAVTCWSSSVADVWVTKSTLSCWHSIWYRHRQTNRRTDGQTDRRRELYLVSKHALFLTDGSNHLIHFFRHFLQKPVSVLDTCCTNWLTLQHHNIQH